MPRITGDTDIEQLMGSTADGSIIPPKTTLESPSLKFKGRDRFFAELRRRVDHFFESTGRRPRDCPGMYVKTTIVLTWFALSYALLVFVSPVWWITIPLTISLGLAAAGVGFNVQHDGGHGAYSSRPWVNRLAAMTLDLLGGSSYVWARKHNAIHHSYTNVVGHDDDINLGFLGRLAPDQKRLNFHRFQHYYLWFLYGFLPMKWHLIDDFRDVITGRIGGHRFPRPKGRDLLIFIGGKLFFFSFALGIPMLLHPVWMVLVFYAAASFVSGLTLAVVFQMAHCVEKASFPMPEKETGRIESAWAAHQVETTVNFAPRNRLLSWYIGGLNYQVEHHLFPQICHVHYRQIAKVVEETCREFKRRYLVNESFLAGIASHFRWLRQMGRAGAAVR